jgi:hypothetical protein
MIFTGNGDVAKVFTGNVVVAMVFTGNGIMVLFTCNVVAIVDTNRKHSVRRWVPLMDQELLSLQ